MKSKIYIGKTLHSRFWPKEHSFSYPLYFFGVDLDELNILNNKFNLFAYNSFSIFSIWDKDYAGVGDETIKIKVLKNFPGLDIEKVVLFTMPRFFGYVFNPVSFFYCFDAQKELIAILAEVKNTFGETHIYKLKSGEKDAKGKHNYEFDKSFFVSPFMDVSGQYQIITHDIDPDFDITVNLFENKKNIFTACLFGKAREFKLSNTLKLLIRFPFTAFMTMTRIYLQAFKLYFLRKLDPYKQAVNLDPRTFYYKRLNFFDKFRSFAFRKSKLTKADK